MNPLYTLYLVLAIAVALITLIAAILKVVQVGRWMERIESHLHRQDERLDALHALVTRPRRTPWLSALAATLIRKE